MNECWKRLTHQEIAAAPGWEFALASIMKCMHVYGRSMDTELPSPFQSPLFFFFFAKRTLCTGQQSAFVNTHHPSSGSQMKRRDPFFRLLIDSKKKLYRFQPYMCFFLFRYVFLLLLCKLKTILGIVTVLAN